MAAGQLDLGNGDLASARARSGHGSPWFVRTPSACAPNRLGCLETCAALARAENRLATAARLSGAIELARAAAHPGATAQGRGTLVDAD